MASDWDLIVRRWSAPGRGMMAAAGANNLGQLSRDEGGYAAARKYQELLDQCCGTEMEEEEEEQEKVEKQSSSNLEEEADRYTGKVDVAHLEAKSEVKFNRSTFCKELFYHVLFPLSMPMLWYMEGGWLALVNRGFVSRDQLGQVVTQWTLAIALHVLNGVAAVYVVGKGHWTYIYQIALVNILCVLRDAVVATKYAFTSSYEMQKMRTSRVPVEVHYSRTLLRAWRDPIPKHIMMKELYLAAVRCRLLKPAFFRVENVEECKQAIQDMVDDLTGDEDALSMGLFADAKKWLKTDSCEVAHPGLLPVHLYAAHILWQSSSLSRLRRVGHTLLSQHLWKCSLAIGVFHGALPEVVHVILGGRSFPGPPWTRYFVPISSSILIAFNMFSSVAFMMIGVLDFRRRHYVAGKLDELLRYGVYNGDRDGRGTSRATSRSSSSVGSKTSSLDSRLSRGSRSSTALSGPGIVVDFTDPDSLLAWWTCRQLTQSFGLSFHKRIKFYTTYFACYCGILLVYIGLRLFTGIRKGDVYILVTITFSIYVFLFLLALMVWPGGDVNMTRLSHGVTLIHRKLSLQRRIRINHKDMSPEEITKARRAVETMTSIAEAVKWDNGKNEMSICGFEAGEQLISVIVATVTASISIGVGQIAQNGFK